MTTAWRLFSFFHNSNGNIKWLHDIETHLQNLLAYKTQLLITLFNINIMIFLGMCQKCYQYNNILIHNILVPFLEWIIITIFTSLLFIYYDTYARKSFSEFILIFVLLKFIGTEKRRWNEYHRRYIAEKCVLPAENRRFSVITLLSGAKSEQVSANNFCESRSERQTKLFVI